MPFLLLLTNYALNINLIFFRYLGIGGMGWWSTLSCQYQGHRRHCIQDIWRYSQCERTCNKEDLQCKVDRSRWLTHTLIHTYLVLSVSELPTRGRSYGFLIMPHRHCIPTKVSNLFRHVVIHWHVWTTTTFFGVTFMGSENTKFCAQSSGMVSEQ